MEEMVNTSLEYFWPILVASNYANIRFLSYSCFAVKNNWQKMGNSKQFPARVNKVFAETEGFCLAGIS